MTTEELMQPRYEVIADYPFSSSEIGQIIVIDIEALEKFYSRFPAIFRRMTWAEDRKPEDLPEYAKSTKKGNVVEIFKWVEEGQYFTTSKSPYAIWCNVRNWDPATASDYEAYLKQQK